MAAGCGGLGSVFVDVILNLKLNGGVKGAEASDKGEGHQSGDGGGDFGDCEVRAGQDAHHPVDRHAPQG